VFDKANNKALYTEKTFTTEAKEEPKPEPKDTHYIVLTTDKAVGEKIELDIYAFDEYKAGVWVDLNGNGKWDEGIDEKPTEFNRKIKYTLQAQRIRIYGIVRYMECPKNQLTEVDISHTPALIRLYAAENNLPSIAHLEDIEELSIDSHTLLASSLPEGLTELIVRETTPLTTINTSLFTELENLNVFNCKSLKSLDLRNNEKLLTLYISKTGLTELDLSHQPQLRDLYADYTPLTKLNVAGNRALQYVRIQLTYEGKGLQGEALMDFLKQLPTKEANNKGSIYLSPAQATEAVKNYLASKHWKVN
jgi:leucine rich repeat domain protein